MIDIILIAVVAGVTWATASEGFWGAALLLLTVLFSGLMAMNYFEPLAATLQATLSASYSWSLRWDFIALVGLFAGCVLLVRAMTRKLSPHDVLVHPLANEIGRWGCGLLTGYVTMAILLTALHTAPLPRNFLGFRPERRNLLDIAAPDIQWLGFTQYVSEHSLKRHPARLFDGPHEEFPGQNNEVWPSFPIRYATRRGSATAAAPPPTQTVQPSSGGSGEPVF